MRRLHELNKLNCIQRISNKLRVVIYILSYSEIISIVVLQLSDFFDSVPEYFDSKNLLTWSGELCSVCT